MTTNIREDIRDIDNGEADQSTFRRLREYLLSASYADEDLYNAVSVYLEDAPIIDWQIALKYVKYPDDPLVAAAAIAAAALRDCPDAAFWNAVTEVAEGEAWDSMDDARIQAILALNRSPITCDEKAKKILRSSLSDESAAVRDSAAIAAQRCFGIPENEILAGGAAGTLSTRLQKQVLKWLE